MEQQVRKTIPSSVISWLAAMPSHMGLTFFSWKVKAPSSFTLSQHLLQFQHANVDSALYRNLRDQIWNDERSFIAASHWNDDVFCTRVPQRRNIVIVGPSVGVAFDVRQHEAVLMKSGSRFGQQIEIPNGRPPRTSASLVRDDGGRPARAAPPSIWGPLVMADSGAKRASTLWSVSEEALIGWGGWRRSFDSWRSELLRCSTSVAIKTKWTN